MKLHVLSREQFLPVSLPAAWEFFSSPRNLDSITPPDLGFRIVHCPGDTMYDGQIIVYQVKLAPALWVPWVTEIKAVEPMRAFVDEQRAGPYRFWHHRHTFEAVPGGVRMTDLVHYALPCGPLGRLLHAPLVRPKLQRIFDFRAQALARHFQA